MPTSSSGTATSCSDRTTATWTFRGCRTATWRFQVFGVVTGFPLFPSVDNNKDSSDAVATLAKLQEWPKRGPHKPF